MKKDLAALLIAVALVVGLFLPSAVFAMQDMSLRHDEDPGIEKVDLSIASGLGMAEKLDLFADPDSTLVEVGLGRYQTADTLSALSWDLLSLLSGNGCDILDAKSAVQEQQSAAMITNGTQAFIFWRVLFTDELGNTVRLYFDDETGRALGLSYSGTAKQKDEWAFAAFELIAAMNGFTAELVAENTEWSTQEYLATLSGADGTCNARLWIEDDFFGVITAWAG